MVGSLFGAGKMGKDIFESEVDGVATRGALIFLCPGRERVRVDVGK